MVALYAPSIAFCELRVAIFCGKFPAILRGTTTSRTWSQSPQFRMATSNSSKSALQSNATSTFSPTSVARPSSHAPARRPISHSVPDDPGTRPHCCKTPPLRTKSVMPSREPGRYPWSSPVRNRKYRLAWRPRRCSATQDAISP